MGHDSESLVVNAGRERGWVQSADVITQDHRSMPAAAAWARDVLNMYPGCVLAAARHVEGRWLLAAARNTRHPAVLHLPGNMITPEVADELIRIVLSFWQSDGGPQ
jgi:hypothetical protein